MLPNLEIAAIGAELDQGDRIALDTYATQVSDLVWRLDQAKLLTAVEEGREVPRGPHRRHKLSGGSRIPGCAQASLGVRRVSSRRPGRLPKR